ncbi:MAG: DUF1841 family protein [Gammaproteobacteria bacterium]|nr:MAG: DUF1841 family protein [Gammaproteobacteria bacterium]
MLYGQDRQEMRAVYFRAWQRYCDNQPLEDMEQHIVSIALMHPEYHVFLASPEKYSDTDYLPEHGQTNPFLHMGMHLAISEQLALNQPPGIQDYHTRFLQQTGDDHSAQHRMMECLGETLWQAQRSGLPPDNNDYLACLQRLSASPEESPT